VGAVAFLRGLSSGIVEPTTDVFGFTDSDNEKELAELDAGGGTIDRRADGAELGTRNLFCSDLVEMRRFERRR